MKYIRSNFVYNPSPIIQSHVHEIQGYVEIAEQFDDSHIHRIATVSDEVIAIDKQDHVHAVVFRTDFYKGHFHEFYGRTSGAKSIGDRHVHFIKSVTTKNDGHMHNFTLASFIEDPMGAVLHV